jgi:hypothetical protein
LEHALEYKTHDDKVDKMQILGDDDVTIEAINASHSSREACFSLHLHVNSDFIVVLLALGYHRQLLR